MASVLVSQRPSVVQGSNQGNLMAATTPGGISLPSPIIGTNHFSGSGSRPVPMKLFATWEVDRTPPNCIPRLCSLTLTRLVLHKSLGMGIGSVVIAVKMEGSKRTLRSNEIVIPQAIDPSPGYAGKILDTELELTFSLQYPHFVKRGGNRLHVMLQRRKRYKNRAILVGFKTLAVGTVDMSQVLQKQMDLELELYVADSKASANMSGAGAQSDIVVGKVSVFSLSSQPVDSSTVGGSAVGRPKGRLGDGDDDRTETGSDEDEDDSSSPESDSAEDTPRRKSRGAGNQERGAERGASAGKSASSARQQNLKRRFIALMKKFKVEGLGRVEQVELDRELSEAAVDPAEIDYLFDQLEEQEDSDDLSDSGPDTISVGSTPKPSLKPFFTSSRSDLHDTRITVSHTLSGGGAIPKALSRPDDHLTLDQGQGLVERHSDDSTKDPGGLGGTSGLTTDPHPDILTDDQENEMSDPPIVGTTTTTNTTASSGDEAPRRDRTSKKMERPFTMLKQQQQSSHQQQQTSHKVLKERQSSEQLQVQRYPPKHDQGIEVASANATRKALIEQLSRVLPNDVDTLPETVLLANTSDHYGARLAEKLSDSGGFKVVCATNPAEVKASLTCLVAKIQKFCNTQTWETPPLVKVALIGADDSFVSSALRAYVEVFSSKPPDWQSFVKFYIVPPVVSGGNIGTSAVWPTSTAVARYISGKDEMYAQLFAHPSWRDLLDSKEDDMTKEIVARIVKYLNGADNSSPMQLPVAEAMVTYKEEKATGEESSQVFLPFLSDVRVGSDGMSDPDDGLAAGSSPSDRLTPPSSPRLIKDRVESGSMEPVDLQLDYWVVVQGEDRGSGIGSSKKADLSIATMSNAAISKSDAAKRTVETTGNKSSIKASIIHMQVQRLGDHPTGFTMNYWTAKDKKPKATVIRLGKKKADQQKEREMKSVEGITRLICLSKGHNTPLKVHIDGSEWSGVKFFQLSSQWQTHIKYFPVATLHNQ